MTQTDEAEKANDLLTEIIKRNITAEAYAWLSQKINAYTTGEGNKNSLNVAFTAVPRKTGKESVILTEEDSHRLRSLVPGFSVQHWSIDRLCRVWLLLQLNDLQKEHYLSSVKSLFPQAEMNEQVALYSALPLLRYPEEWRLQCAIGIRSNIGSVLEAIMYFNPYPAAWLDDGAWNQLIMKAFFTGKDVRKIIGLDKRANPDLAATLFDYVEERWSAHRSVNPQIWRLSGKFLDDKHFYMMERLFSEDDETSRKAAALACSDSALPKTKKLLDEHPLYKNAIGQNELNWETI